MYSEEVIKRLEDEMKKSIEKFFGKLKVDELPDDTNELLKMILKELEEIKCRLPIYTPYYPYQPYINPNITPYQPYYPYSTPDGTGDPLPPLAVTICHGGVDGNSTTYTKIDSENIDYTC